MDRRHLSPERAPATGHLAHRRSGSGHSRARSEAASPTAFAGKAGGTQPALEALARRRGPAFLARLPFETRPEVFQRFPVIRIEVNAQELARQKIHSRGFPRNSKPHICSGFSGYLVQASRASPVNRCAVGIHKKASTTAFRFSATLRPQAKPRLLTSSVKVRTSKGFSLASRPRSFRPILRRTRASLRRFSRSLPRMASRRACKALKSIGFSK